MIVNSFDFRFLVQNNYSVILMLGLLLGYLFTDTSFDRYTLRQFIICTFTLMVMTIADNAEIYFNSKPHYSNWGYLVGLVYYVTRGFMPYLMFNIAYYRSHREKNPHTLLWLMPVLVDAFLCATNIFTHWVFSLDAPNVFHRGPLNVVAFLTPFFYFLVMLRWSRLLLGSNTREAIIVSVIVVVSTVSTLLETFCAFRLLIDKSTTVCVFVYYLFLYTQIYNRDALTDVFNRRRFYLDAKALHNSPFTVVSMDMNGLKEINDTLGHHAGDKALLACADCMRKALPLRASLYRIGGDEFVVLAPRLSKEQMLPSIKRMQNMLAECGYSVACGLAEFNPGDDFEKVLTHSDQRMYQAKAMMKARESLEKMPKGVVVLPTIKGRMPEA